MLKIDIFANDMELTDAIRSAIETKLGTLDKFLEHAGTPQELRVDVGKTTQHHNKGQLFRAEANLRIPGDLIRAENTSYELYGAIDLLKDELKREIVKKTGAKTDSVRDGARRAKEQGTETELV